MAFESKLCLAIIAAILLGSASFANSNEDFYDRLDTSALKVESREVKCHVCKATIDEMLLAVAKVDPKKRTNVGGYQMDANGNAVTKSIQYSKSETYLTELMENICEKMDDYVKARYKRNKQLTILKVTSPDGHMNPEMSAVDFIQDGDLNKSLKHFCLEVLEDNEDALLGEFMKDETPENIDIQVCTVAAKYCDDSLPEEEYVMEEDEQRDEL